MPGRTAARARDAFLEPLKRALTCVTTAQFLASYTKAHEELGALTLSEDPLPLRSSTRGDLSFVLVHSFRMVKESARSWHVSTAAYYYRLDDADHRELISWHWHPDPLPGPGYPHLHLASSAVGKHAHVPTGRVSIESVLRFLITELDVTPRRPDYLDVLDEAERPFIEYRRWHA